MEKQKKEKNKARRKRTEGSSDSGEARLRWRYFVAVSVVKAVLVYGAGVPMITFVFLIERAMLNSFPQGLWKLRVIRKLNSPGKEDSRLCVDG